MATRIRGLLLTGLILISPLLLAAVEPPVHPLITPERLAELEKGKPVVTKSQQGGEKGGDAASACALGLIEKPAAETWAVLCDFEKQSEFMPRLKTVERDDSSAPAVSLSHTLKIMWNQINYHLLMDIDDAAMHQSWKLDDSKKNDIKSATGSWTVLPWGDNRCIVVYEIEANTGMAIPKFLAQILLKQDVPGVIGSLKKRVESDGTWKKE
jgi:hypothetical protein